MQIMNMVMKSMPALFIWSLLASYAVVAEVEYEFRVGVMANDKLHRAPAKLANAIKQDGAPVTRVFPAAGHYLFNSPSRDQQDHVLHLQKYRVLRQGLHTRETLDALAPFRLAHSTPGWNIFLAS